MGTRLELTDHLSAYLSLKLPLLHVGCVLEYKSRLAVPFVYFRDYYYMGQKVIINYYVSMRGVPVGEIYTRVPPLRKNSFRPHLLSSPLPPVFSPPTHAHLSTDVVLSTLFHLSIPLPPSSLLRSRTILPHRGRSLNSVSVPRMSLNR